MVMGIPNLGNLLGGLGGLVPGAGNKPATKIIGRFEKTLTHADWWDSSLETSANSIAVTAGNWAIIGRYQIRPNQRVHFGYGSPALPDNQGYMYLALYDDTATNSVLEEGQIRLVQSSYDGLNKVVVGEWSTRDLRGDVNDKKKKTALPEQAQFPWVREDSYLEIHFLPEASDVLVKTAIGTAAGLDIWQIPVTIETKA